MENGIDCIGRDAKKVLLNLLGEPIVIGGQAGPMMVQLARITTSLVECIEGTRAALDLPEQPLQGVQVLPKRFGKRPETPK